MIITRFENSKAHLKDSKKYSYNFLRRSSNFEAMDM
jgi:hypothetical protein